MQNLAGRLKSPAVLRMGSPYSGYMKTLTFVLSKHILTDTST
jgi:hypothetical protein